MISELVKKVKIVYFSGTGGTARIVELADKLLKKNDIDVEKEALEKCFHQKRHFYNNDGIDLIIVLFPVHAFDAPEPIYYWIKNIPKSDGMPVAVISVSAGGEVWLNSACRTGCINKLEHKGYKVIYERMLVMPSNWVVATEARLSLRLLQVLPLKTEQFISEILSGVKRRKKSKLGGKILTMLFKLEKPGAKVFGKGLKIRRSCTGCGWCASKCPRENIEIQDNKPAFKWNCMACLRCVYGCPQKAIYSDIFSFIIIKEGYNLGDLESQIKDFSFEPTENINFGYLNKGVKDYLLDR